MIEQLNENGLRMGLESMSVIIRHLETRLQYTEVEMNKVQNDIDTFGKLLAFAKQQQMEMHVRLNQILETKK